MSSKSDGKPIYMASLFFLAPVIGIRKRWPNVLHAVELEGLTMDPDGTCESACGLKGLRVAISGSTVGLWPPYVKGLGNKTRCPECYRVCKKKKPRSRFVQREAS